MKKMLTLLFVVCLVFNLAPAQSWTFDSDFTDGPLAHGVVVDPDGKIWVGYYGYTDTLGLPGDTIPIKPIYVYNADGTEASFSPIRTLTIDGTIDTMFNGCRGITTDNNGNILYSAYDDFWRINYLTGAGMNRAQPIEGKSLTEAGVDDDGNIYIGHVVPGGAAGHIYDTDFELYGTIADSTFQIGRSLVVTGDASDVYWGAIYDARNGIVHYNSGTGGVDGPWTLVDTLYGATVASGEPRLWAQCLDWDNNGLLWVGTYWNVAMGDYHGWYALDPTQNFAIVDEVGTPQDPQDADDHAMDSNVWAPRGAAWDAAGTTMYTADFDGSVIKKWTNSSPAVPGATPIDVEVSVDREDRAPVAEGYRLAQNYPNPFNPETTIEFEIPDNSVITVAIYNLTGELVKTLRSGYHYAGQYNVTWNGTNDAGQPVSSGSYIYNISADGVSISKVMTFIK